MRIPSLTLASVTATIACCLPLNAQSDTFGQSWRWVHFTEEDGLPAKLVYNVVETSAGTPWVNTLSGPAWYDGYRWHSVDASLGLPETHVSRIIPDDRGGLFVHSGNDIYRGDEHGFQRLELIPKRPAPILK